MIAPSNQMLTQGGILSRDWFSDRLAVINGDIQIWVLRDSRRLDGTHPVRIQTV